MRRPVLLSLALAAGTAFATLGSGGAAAAAVAALPAYVADPAALVDPIIGTSGFVDDFPGAVSPFGLVQWSPDTPSRPAGGGYEYDDKDLTGYSLTHISGPGCAAFGDVPILPTSGAVGDDPGNATVPFSHDDEVAKAGSYGLTAGGVKTELTTTTRSGMGRFTFPKGDDGNLLFKLSGSAAGVDATRVQIVNDHEITGSVTSGHFCGADDHYTVHFDMVFDHPFAAYGTWQNDAVTKGSRSMRHTPSGPDTKARKAARPTPTPSASASAGPGGRHEPPRYHGRAPDGTRPDQVKLAPPQSGADGAYVTFDTATASTVQAKVGVSFTSDANAKANRVAENASWDFAKVQAAAYAAWKQRLSAIRIGGGDARSQRIFYTALYHVLIHPNVFSDVNGQYMGFDDQVHKATKGHAQYANFSGWDIYRTQAQLMAAIAPKEASDAIRSMLNQYDQTGKLPKWSLANGESYVMVGDPAAPILTGAYAFGARDFDTTKALNAMVAEAEKPNDVRPGLNYYKSKNYLPMDGDYGCCNFYGPVSTQLEYDSADHSIASYAKALGKADVANRLATRAQNWQHVFNPGTGYVQAKDMNGTFEPGFSPSTSAGMVEGTAAQYTPMVPFDVEGLARAAGGHDAWAKRLDKLMENVADPGSENADLSNEPSFEIPWEYSFVGQPWKTQTTVRQVQQAIYTDQPDGMAGNDDLGTMSAWYVWSALGMYPETPGTADMTLGSPVFPRAQVTLANGKKLTVTAPQAAQNAPYVKGLKLNGAAWTHAYLKPSVMTGGGTLAFTLGTTPDKSWASKPADAPPSDTTGLLPALGYAASGSSVVVAPGDKATVKIGARSLGKADHVDWTASADSGVTAGPKSGTLVVPAGGTGSQSVGVTAGTKEGRYLLTFHLQSQDGTDLPDVVVEVDVAKPGALWPYYNNVGVGNDGEPGANLDGGGWAYSAQALAAQGVEPGGTVTADGLDYVWPDVPAGERDNIEVGGQQIPVAAPDGAGRIGFLGSATNSDEKGASGDVTVTYTDGTTDTVHLVFSDWTLGAGGFDPVPGNTKVASMPYRNTSDGGKQTVSTYVFAASGEIQAGKTVAKLGLPETPQNGSLHVFSFAYGS